MKGTSIKEINGTSLRTVKPPPVPKKHGRKMHRGMWVDSHLPTEALDKLNSLEGIEIVSTCEGKDTHNPAHLGIRIESDDRASVENFTEAMSRHDDVLSWVKTEPIREGDEHVSATVRTAHGRLVAVRIPIERFGPHIERARRTGTDLSTRWSIDVIAPDLWYEKNPKKFRRWWRSLPDKIERSLRTAKKSQAPAGVPAA